MNFFQRVWDWQAARQEKHHARMAASGRCPDCGGKGFFPAYSDIYVMATDCMSCDGSGLYADWLEANQ